jgi:hypothetical protein
MNKKLGTDSKGRTVLETDFWDAGDWLLELVQGRDGRPVFIHYHRDGGQWKFVDRFETDKHVLLLPEQEPLLHQVRFSHYFNKSPITPSLLLQAMNGFLPRCLDLDQDSGFLMACFILSTWLVDTLPVAPGLSLVGMPDSGKSTGLRVLGLLCRRALLTSDISSAAFCNLCTQLMPTLLIDETATAGQQRSLFHLLRSGSAPDTLVFRQKQSYSVYGSKVVAWTELPDDQALNSRYTILPMRASLRTDLARPSDPAIVEAADYLQGSLLRFRLDYFHKMRTARIPYSGQLHGRARDLFEALALPISEDPELCQRLLACLEDQQEVNFQRLSARQSAVLEALGQHVRHHPREEFCSLKSLTKATNQELADAGEHFHLNERAVGSTLTSLGLVDHKRTNAGYVLYLDNSARRHIHASLVRHGSGCPWAAEGAACEFCNPPASPQPGPAASE